jgi:K+-sensing histidine kinase KdpD
MRKSTEYRPGLRPWSLPAFLVALTTVAVAAAVQEILLALGTMLQFASFVPAILLASFLAGVQAAIFAAVLSIPIVWWEFLPPRFEFNPFTAADYLSFSHFSAAELAGHLVCPPLLAGSRAIKQMTARRNASPADNPITIRRSPPSP